MALQEGNSQAGKAAAAEDLPDGGHAEQGQGKAQAGQKAVQNGGAEAAGRGGFPVGKDGQVNGHNGQVHAQHLVHTGQESVHQKLDDGHKARHDQHIGRELCPLRDQAAQSGDEHSGQQHHQQHGDAHTQGGDHAAGLGHCGAGAQKQHQNGIFRDGAESKRAFLIFVHQLFPPSVAEMAWKAANTSSVATVMALVLAVAPEIRACSPVKLSAVRPAKPSLYWLSSSS